MVEMLGHGTFEMVGPNPIPNQNPKIRIPIRIPKSESNPKLESHFSHMFPICFPQVSHAFPILWIRPRQPQTRPQVCVVAPNVEAANEKIAEEPSGHRWTTMGW